MTNLDYARNRYYSSTLAHFTTPDPYRASGGPADPQSSNRYAYVQNDPVNFNDPLGLDIIYVGSGMCPAGVGEYAKWVPCDYYNITAPRGPVRKETCADSIEIPADETERQAAMLLLGEGSASLISTPMYLPGDTAGHPSGPPITQTDMALLPKV